MKTFSETGKQSPELKKSKSTAFSYLITNLLVLPGLGSVMAGYKIGYTQMVLALYGFLTVMYWLIWICFTIITKRSDLFIHWMEHSYAELFDGPYTWMILTGFPAAVLSWIWALITSLQILKAHKENGSNSSRP